jgi:flagellar basal-body rod protein FlgF
LVRGLYTSATGALVAQSMVDNVANNLANVNTSGFKQTMLQITAAPSFNIFRVQTDPGHNPRSPLPGVSTAQYVGVLGTGSWISDTPTDFAQGSLQTTGNKLDLALSGNDAAFFSVQTPNGVRYTRNGEFVKDATGTIVTQDGNPVLNTQGQPIVLADNSGDVTIAPDGTVSQTGAAGTAATRTIGQIGITQFSSLLNMRPEGSSNYAPSGNAGGTPATGVTVVQGALERSNSSPIRSMVDLITAERWFDMNEKSIKTQDDATNAAINTIARPNQ